MNSNELMKDLYKVLKTSGWLDKATKHFREHPKMFSNCVNNSGKIANINVSVSYQPESLSAIADVKPNVFISAGNIHSTMYDYNVYDNNVVQSRTWIDGEIVVEEKTNV